MVATLSSIFTIFDGIARHILKNLSFGQIKVAEVSASFNPESLNFDIAGANGQPHAHGHDSAEFHKIPPGNPF
jgi:hypothetical protein